MRNLLVLDSVGVVTELVESVVSLGVVTVVPDVAVVVVGEDEPGK